jgi:SAM-dependent methyltransferase
MHREAFLFIQKSLANLDTSGMDVVELGAFIVNGSVRPLFPTTTSYTGVDLRGTPRDGVDAVADAADYQPDEPVDLVVSTEMLEHAPRQAEVIANCARMLKPGGRLLLTAAGVGREPHTNDGDRGDLGDEFYHNVSEEELAAWLTAAGFATFEITHGTSHGIERGDIYVAAQMPVSEDDIPAPGRRRPATAPALRRKAKTDE